MISVAHTMKQNKTHCALYIMYDVFAFFLNRRHEMERERERKKERAKYKELGI